MPITLLDVSFCFCNMLVSFLEWYALSFLTPASWFCRKALVPKNGGKLKLHGE